jgi:hypothetical protein
MLTQQAEQPLSIRVTGRRMRPARVSAQCDRPTRYDGRATTAVP